MTTPNTKEWSAWINLMPGSTHKLIVVGKVETNAANLKPVLKEAVPQGFNPAILMLDLTIEDDGSTGPQVVGHRDARFEKPAEQGHYTSVTVRFEGEEIADIEVKEAR